MALPMRYSGVLNNWMATLQSSSARTTAFHLSKRIESTILTRFRRRPFLQPRRHLSTTKHTPTQAEQLSLGQRLRKLFREQGRVALAVYLGLSVLDFGLTFLAISALGADYVRQVEYWLLSQLRISKSQKNASALDQPPETTSSPLRKVRIHIDEWAKHKQEVHDEAHTEHKMAQSQKEQNPLVTTAILAYTIHKTAFLPIRVGLTAAVTPSVTKCVFL